MDQRVYRDAEKGVPMRLDTSRNQGQTSNGVSERRTPMSSTPSFDDLFQNYAVDRHLLRIRDNSESANNDEMAISEWRKRLFKLVPISAALLAMIILHLAKVQLDVMSELRRRVTWQERVFMSVVFTVQVFTALSSFLLYRHAGRSRWRPRLFLTGEMVPSVDIVICCCNEDIDVILDTVRAALHQDYPRHRYRVIVTDDGRSPELEKNIMAMAGAFPNLYYTARIKVGSAGPAEMMAGLDADLMPERRWLRSMMPHILGDAKMGCVCPPQHFYNQPLNDPLYGSQRDDARSLEVAKDMADMAWCTGSGWIMRRTALESIEGFPTSSLTEDVYTSMLMLTKGWKASYVPEALQYGLMPDTYYGHCKQHTRWAIGGGQVGFLMRFGLSSVKAGVMSLDQRLTLFLLTTKPFTPIVLGLGLISTPVLLFSPARLVYYDNLTQLRHIVRLRCAQVFMSWLHKVLLSVFTGYELTMRQECNAIWESPYFTWSLLRSFFLPKWLGGKVAGFVPTGSIPDTLNERHPTKRSLLHVRLKVVLLDCGALFHLIFIVLVSLGVLHRIRVAQQAGPSPAQIWVELLAMVASPPLHWLQQVLACLTPLQYAIWPPEMPDREELLDRDPVTNVARPKKEYRTARFRWLGAVGYSQTIHVVLLGVVCIYIGTWWI